MSGRDQSGVGLAAGVSDGAGLFTVDGAACEEGAGVSAALGGLGVAALGLSLAAVGGVDGLSATATGSGAPLGAGAFSGADRLAAGGLCGASLPTSGLADDFAPVALPAAVLLFAIENFLHFLLGQQMISQRWSIV